MMRKFERGTAVVDEELHDLKLRFELLDNQEGDRKAYYETSQWAIRRNKEEVNNLRQQNKHLSDAISRIKKSELSVSNAASMTELEKFDHKIYEIQKKYDELHADVKSKEQKLRKLNDQLADLTKEAEMLNSNAKDSPETKEIRMLENRLDKAMIKYNETQSIKKTYELIVKRLQEERLTFDNQLSSFEKALRAKKQDAAELELMSRDANHAKDVAKAELARFEQQINEERKQREKDLQIRKEMVKHKLEVSDKSDKRGVAKQDDQNPETSGKSDVVTFDEAAEKKMVEYEETMRLIKEATGVSDINEVIAKFQSQGETLEHLSQLQKTNEARVSTLQKKKIDTLHEYEELQYSGEAKHSQSISTLEQFKAHLNTAQTEYLDAKQNYDRSIKILSNAKAGIAHLNDKLEAIKMPDQSSKPAIVNDGTVVEVMQLCIKKLEMLATNLQNKDIPEAPPKDPNQSQQPGENVGILNVNPSLLPTHNTRVKLRPLEFEEADVEEEDDDDEYEVPDRETMKKQTAQMINARLKTKQTKKTKKKKAAKEDDESS